MTDRIQQPEKGMPVDRAGFRGLLREERRPGYPAEYLFTRLRGRRAMLLRNWRSLAYVSDLAALPEAVRSPLMSRERTVAGLWRALFREHGWVFRQMDERLRTIFAPYFVHTELRTLFISLRSLAGESGWKAEDALGNSLLSGRIKAALGKGDAGDAMARIEAEFRIVSSRFAGIARIFFDRGAREMEREMTNRLIAAALDSALHPVIRRFFTALVDSRNLLSLYASIRAGSADPLAFMEDGRLSPGRLRDLQEKGDLFAVLPLIRQVSGIAVLDPDPTQVEVALYRGVTRFAKIEGRDPLSEGLILDYLWRCSIEVTNLGLLITGKDLDREAVLAEMVT